MNDITPAERQQLAAVRQQFNERMEGLTPRLQLARARSIATLDIEDRETDALTKALARQAVDLAAIRDKMAAIKAELAEIDATNLNGYRPADPHFKGRVLARKDELEREFASEALRAQWVAEQSFTSAEAEAVAEFRAADAERQYNAKLADAIKRQEQAQKDQAIEDQAASIVRSRRLAIGRDRSAGEAQ